MFMFIPCSKIETQL